MTTNIVYSKEFDKHDNIGHPENARRLRVMYEELRQAPFYDELNIVEPEILSEEMLRSVHSDEMIQ
ncbi:MAG: histone deacetylase family protein, partial [Thermoplasmatota archaeon]